MSVENISKIVLAANQKHVNIYNEYIRKSDFAGKMYILIVQFTVSLFVILPGLELHINKSHYEVHNGTDVKNKPMPLSTWLPFNQNEHYVISYILTTVTTIYGGGYTCYSDVFFYALIIFCTGQIKILQEQLKEFKRSSKATNKNENTLVNDEEDTNRNLKECVKQHKIIIK